MLADILRAVHVAAQPAPTVTPAQVAAAHFAALVDAMKEAA